MKKLLIFLFVTAFSFNHFAQNKIMTYEKTGEKILVGICKKEDFVKNDLFSDWFKTTYDNYNPVFLNYDFDKEKIKNYSVKIVLGTWCLDSRREFPRFMKVLDSLDFPEKNLTIICVDRNKHALYGEASGLRIVYVPTIIFYNNKGEETGRIVEHPKGDRLEDDLERILLSK